MLESLLIWGMNLQETIVSVVECREGESVHGGNKKTLQRSYKVLKVGY